MTQIYLIRHAEAEGNLYRRVHGWYNSLITENGYRQIAALEGRFRDIPIDAVYSSDLFRTMTTAKAVCGPKNLPLQTNPGLREVGMGVWEDCTWADLTRNDSEQLRLFDTSSPRWKVKGGESYQETRDRVMATLCDLAAKHDGQTIAVFCHGMAIRCVIAHLHGLAIEEMTGVGHSDNTAVSLLELEGHGGRVVFENDNSHLPKEISTLARQSWWKESGKLKDASLWYQPMDMKKNADFYYQCRQEAWVTIHGSLLHFDGDGFLRDAKQQAKRDKNAVWMAMLEDKPAGILQLDLQRDADKEIGGIPFFYLLPETRKLGLGVQMLGQAVSVYRPLGRQYLRLRCAPDNGVAQRFYRRHGFQKVAEAEGTRVPLDILQKYIGYGERENGANDCSFLI